MNTFRNKLLKLFTSNSKSRTNPPPQFLMNNNTGIYTRAYQSYKEYLSHQREKLSKVFDSVKEYDVQYEFIVQDRYRNLRDWKGSSVLCLAARLGGEVRAFKALGALAIGIDIEPGSCNSYVLHGDFHDIQFADSSFDFAFCNAIDHVFDLEMFVKEVKRILKPNGELILEICTKKPGKYEAIDISNNLESVINILKQSFYITKKETVENKTSFVQWNGQLLFMSKLE